MAKLLPAGFTNQKTNSVLHTRYTWFFFLPHSCVYRLTLYASSSTGCCLRSHWQRFLHGCVWWEFVFRCFYLPRLLLSRLHRSPFSADSTCNNSACGLLGFCPHAPPRW